jgi:hypothetical protein
MKQALIGLTSTTIEIGLFIVIAVYVTSLLFKLLLLLLLFGLMILFLVVYIRKHVL